MEPPADIKKEGMIWKLVKPLYGLKDTSRKFCIRIKEIFKNQGMKTVQGDESFYFKNNNGNLEGMVLTHVDNIAMAGTQEFIARLDNKVRNILNMSKVE